MTKQLLKDYLDQFEDNDDVNVEVDGILYDIVNVISPEEAGVLPNICDAVIVTV